ncbi:MAG: TetR family transcriptional regulator C-terminal domain-containing protein, partial [Magnetospirillum sp. WYHS-4]
DGVLGDRLRAVVRTQLAFMAAVPAVPAILLARGLQSDAAVRRALLGVMGEFGRTLASLLAEGRRSGHFRADLEVERAALMLVALAQGTAVRWLLSDRAFDLVADGMAGVDLALAGSQVETPNRLQA